MNCYITSSRERKHDTRDFDPLFWVYMITLPLAQPTIMIQFLIILVSLSYGNPPLNIDLPIIFILLIHYNITFGSSHPHKIGCRVCMPHKNKITNKQIMKRCVCNNVQIKAHVSRATIWRDDMIFRVNITTVGMDVRS
jgi:hypothetical protein